MYRLGLFEHENAIFNCNYQHQRVFFSLFTYNLFFPVLLLRFPLCPASSSAAFLHVAENLQKSEQTALFSYYLKGGGWHYN